MLKAEQSLSGAVGLFDYIGDLYGTSETSAIRIAVKVSALQAEVVSLPDSHIAVSTSLIHDMPANIRFRHPGDKILICTRQNLRDRSRRVLFAVHQTAQV